MTDIELLPTQEDLLCLVEGEPVLEIAMPQVFAQPQLVILQRGKLPHVEALVAKIYQSYIDNPNGSLGSDYQELINEFQPLFTWTTACWDYLLSTEGCRFVARNGGQKLGVRGDYRAVTYEDYSRLVHGVFRRCMLEFSQQSELPLFSQWLRLRLWPLILEAYRRLDQPSDPRQRLLSPYSYLRCVPYRFLNDFHEELARASLQRVPEPVRQIIVAYFFHFYTESASAEAVGCSLEECRERLRQGLITLLIHHRLVYCLLRQIERY